MLHINRNLNWFKLEDTTFMASVPTINETSMLIDFMKNVVLYSSQKKLPTPLRDIIFSFLFKTFINERFLINEKLQMLYYEEFFFFKNFIYKYDLKFQGRSHKVILIFRNKTFPSYIFCLTSDFIKTLYEW